MKLLFSFVLVLMSAGAQAQLRTTTRWSTETVNLSVQGLNSQARFSKQFDKILEVEVQRTCQEWIEGTGGGWVTGTCYELECTQGAGKSPAWDAFYSAKKEDKARKLADAIKGVGKASSEALVAGNYFSSKPRSWADFKTEIKRAETAGVITAQVSSMVLNQYQNDNRQNLGYSSSDCRSVPYACQIWQDGTPGYYRNYTCTETETQVIDTRYVNFQVNVSNAILLPYETEKFKLNLSPEFSNISVQGAYYNNYNLNLQPESLTSMVIYLEGLQRNRVNLPAESIRSTQLKFYKAANQMQLEVQLDGKYLALEGNESAVLEYVVKTCKPKWTGLCGIGWDEKQAPVTIPAREELVRLNIGVRPGDKAAVEVRLVKKASQFYNAAPVSKETATVRAK